MDQPTQIGQYELIELLGRGAAGSVYRAVDTENPARRAVAVKIVSCDPSEVYEIERRFVREASILNKLNHANVVRYHECGIDDGKLFLVMELVTLGTLKDVLGTPLPWRDAVETALQLCNALDHCHQHGVVHRDLKPSNLFLSEDGTIKLADFGIARDLESQRLTLEGQTVGTCQYMAPEQIKGDDVTAQTDLYAVGLILFEMLDGKPPFTGRAIFELMDQHLDRDPPRLEQRVADCPEPLADLVHKLLAKEPAQRPASAANVGSQLQIILDTPHQPRRHTGPVGPPKPNLTERLVDTSRQSRSGPSWKTLAGLAKRLWRRREE